MPGPVGPSSSALHALDPRARVMDLLALVGPESERGELASAVVGPEQALAYCRGLAKSHYENFSVLTSLVPKELEPDFAAVYAFCRWSDDLGDETGASAEARARSERLLAWWRGELDQCFGGGSVTHPVFVALRSTLARHPDLTVQPFRDLIDAFVQDQRVTRYTTWDQCVDYCTRSANPVGRIVLTLGGYPDTPANAERYAMSDATCTALQLINFWQDVRRDLVERDRVYLPEKDTGISADELKDMALRGHEPGVRVRYIRAVRPLVERTAELFDQGRGLPSLLDGRVGPVVWLFGAGGDAILEAVESVGCATLWERPRLSKSLKAWLVIQAWARARTMRRAGGGSPGPATVGASR